MNKVCLSKNWVTVLKNLGSTDLDINLKAKVFTKTKHKGYAKL